MKPYRSVVAAALIIILACLAGCGTTTFFFSFVDELGTTNDEYSWITEGPGSLGVGVQGLWMDERAVIFPFRLKGNATITMNMLSACENTELAYFMVMLTDVDNLYYSYHALEMYLGNPADQMIKLCEKVTSSVDRVAMGPVIPGLVNPGENEIVITKRANFYKCYINDVLVGGYSAEDYIAEWYEIVIYCELSSSTDADSIFVRDFNLEISGDYEQLI